MRWLFQADFTARSPQKASRICVCDCNNGEPKTMPITLNKRTMAARFVFVCADRRYKRGRAGADVLTHYNRDSRGICDLACRRQCLRIPTDAELDDNCRVSRPRHAEYGVGEGEQNITDSGTSLSPAGARHCLHAKHECRKPSIIRPMSFFRPFCSPYTL